MDNGGHSRPSQPGRDIKRSITAAARRVLPGPVRRRLRQAVGRYRVKRGAIGSEERRRATQNAQLARDISAISRAVWIGFTTDGLADLERIRRAGGEPGSAVARACETLARWYATNGQYELALDRLIHARVLNGADHKERLLVLEHHALTKLGLTDEADQLYERYGHESPDLRLMQANLWLRRAELGEVSRELADAERLRLIDWTFEQNGVRPISALVTPGWLNFTSLGADLTVSTVPLHPDSNAAAPLVSVIVPAYNAAQTLAASVNSMRAQIHRNLEIVIVDDCSTDDTYDVATALAAQDPRVKVIRHDENLGAYGARNTGLEKAAGELVTVHDADDWSHPQLIERQVAVLADTGAAGSFSRLARVSPDFEFLLRPYRPMLEPIHWNYTSLLVPTETIREFGGWDRVRAHADSDLIERLREYFGRDSLVETDISVPLSFFLVTGSNLTEASSTSLRSVDFGARREYSEQARFWRRRTFDREEIPTYRAHNRSDSASPFYCPSALSTLREKTNRTYDLVLGSDLALQGGTRNCNLAYLKCAQELGLRVGVFNTPRYRKRRSGAIDDVYRELFQSGEIDLLTPEDDVEAKALLLHHPPVLQHAFDGYPRVKSRSHYMLVNQLPWQMKDYTDVQYSADAIRENYGRAFGSEPLWIPITPRVRTYLSRAVDVDAMYDEDWYPIVPWPISAPRRSLDASSVRPVIGRHSRDHFTKWPESPDVLRKCYFANRDYDVRLLGGARAAEQVLGYRPDNWHVYEFDSLPVLQFLGGVDVFLHFHHSMYIEEFGRNIAEAMATGVPCVLPEEYRETFGDAAVYARPDEIEDAVMDMWSDSGRYGEYAERGADFVRCHSAVEVGVGRLERLLSA